MKSFTRRAALFAAGLALAAPLAFGAPEARAESVLKVVPHADLKNLDPIWTTAYISRNHGYLVYDTLFALDADLTPQPQMVGDYSVSEDRLSWSFTLRDGLKWHDGTPVTSEDCIASLKRWGARDGMGQALMAVVSGFEAVDDKTFTMSLTEPYGLVLESIGKISSNVPFMMPKRLAETDPFEQVPEVVGSGPFKFVADEWVPGSKVVYVKNEDYVPRDEPPSNAAGGKVAKVDRVEWIYIPDQTTAMNALINGEIDYYESPPPDLAPILAATPGLVVETVDPIGSMGYARFNSLHPPFDNPDIRRAAMKAMTQVDYMQAAIGDPKYYKTCASMYPCGTPLQSDAGSEIFETDVAEAKSMLEAAGYDGTPVVIMQPTDIAVLSAFSLVTAQKLRDIGMEVEVQAMDWATLTSRRAKREPVAEGGWNMFHTWWIGADVLNPMAIAFSGDRAKGWFGWPESAKVEELRKAFALATNDEEKQRIAAEVQGELLGMGASGHVGQFFTPVAYRDVVKGVIEGPVQFFWNISIE